MPRRGNRDAVISPGNQNEHAPQEPVMTPRVTRRMSKADPSVAAAVATNYAISQQTRNISSLSIGRGESSNGACTRRDSPWPVSPSGRGRRGVRQQEDRATPSPRKRKRKADDDTESDEDREKPQDDSQHKQSEASDKGGQQNSPPKKKQYARKTCWLPPNAHQLVKYAAKENASNEGRVSPSPRKRKSDVGTEDVSDEDGEEEQHDGQRKQFGGVAESEKQEAPLRQSARKSCWLPPDAQQRVKQYARKTCRLPPDAYQLTKFAKLNEADRSPPRSRNSSDSEDSQPPQGIAGSSHHGRHGILQSMEQVPVALRTQTPFIEDMTPFIHDDYSNLGNAPKRVRFSRQGGCGRPGCNCGAIRRVVDNAPGEVQDLALMSTRRGRLGQFLDWNSDEDDPTRIVNVLI